ncbi:MAG: xanthine dehydrogenase family protein molybdopterin-binding subunit [Planctomycetota bacterium]
MQDSDGEITIQVGFGDSFKELTVRIPEGDVPPYQPGDRLEVVGQRSDRVDAAAKVTGRARYTYDQRPEGLLHGKILRSPHANANILSVDLEEARKMPGVRAAISFPEVFQQPSIRFAWDGVAAVAADTETQAEEALRSIRVEYEVLPFCVTKEDAMKEGAPRVGRRDQNNVERTSPRRRRGESEEEFEERFRKRQEEVNRLFEESDKVVKGTFETQVHTHAALETHGVVCRWEGEKLICHCSTQSTFGVRRELRHGK